VPLAAEKVKGSAGVPFVRSLDLETAMRESVRATKLEYHDTTYMHYISNLPLPYSNALSVP